jgi:hypothetical protein
LGVGLVTNERSQEMSHKIFVLRIVETVARQWWFLVLVLLPQFIPPYTSRGYELHDWGMVNAYLLTHPIKSSFASLYPVFQIIPLALIVMIFFVGRRVTRIFSAYVFFSYGVIAFVQSISISDRYGFAVCVANLFSFLILAGMWLWESVFPKNELAMQKPLSWKYGIILLALLPFWEPVQHLTLLPDFNPTYILTSGAGLSFCLVTPLYLAILALSFPGVNRTVFVATGFMGAMMGIGNMVLEFVIYPDYWWIGILHIPLFVISVYCLWLSLNEIAVQVKKVQQVLV